MVPKLSLYHFDGCPYCTRVRQALGRLGLEVELRDIRGDPKHVQELSAATGRRTVPVLRIDDPSGTRWLPESLDIIRYLETEVAGKA